MPRIGDIVEGKISGIRNYGAFVAFGMNEQGLIHISEIRDGYVKNINDLVKIDQKITAQIIDIDEYSKKISLSMRTLTKNKQKSRIWYKRMFTCQRKRIGFATIDKKLATWIKEAKVYLAELGIFPEEKDLTKNKG